jgi:hypothetical protein
MPNEPVFFVWNVLAGGYRWTDAETVEGEKPGRYLVQSWNIPEGSKRYQPLQLYPALFRSFADITPTEEDILSFANEYGRLTPLGEMLIVRSERSSKEGTVEVGEPLSLWVSEIAAMNQALTLWDMAQNRDMTGLSGFIHWSEDGVYYDSGPGTEEHSSLGRTTRTIAHLNEGHQLGGILLHGDLVTPALFQVQHVVNQHLEGRLSPRVLWGKDYTHLNLYFMPNSLIGALWLQFAQAIDGNKTYRRCDECRGWFELSPEVARTTKRFCSNACRVKAYRERKATARQLHSEGVGIEGIANRLDSDPETVAGWVSGIEGNTKED